MRRTGLDESQLRQAVSLIESLNPRPGAAISPASTGYITPDVTVRKDQDSGAWRVELNPDATPAVRINHGYAALIRRADTSADNRFLQEHLQNARWLIKGLQSRNETLMNVAVRIVDHQTEFLESGEEAMKPLVLHEVADAIGVHESTVSRAINHKYMHTPRGIYELRYFFSSHVTGQDGGEHSSTAVRAMIKRLIATENAGKPLSDSKLTALLEERGVSVARRTIAKYREAMAIPPSKERKRLI